MKRRNDGTLDVTLYDNPIVLGKVQKIKIIDDDTRDREVDVEDSIRRSLSRAREGVKDIAYANDWELFITVTFDQVKVDRYNFDDVVKKYSQMLKNLKQRHCPNLEYLMVPELHKDGAYHFHGLLRGIDGLKLVEARNFKNNRLLKDKGGKQIYNMPQFKLGLNTATYVVDSGKSASYLVKYITKDLCLDLKDRKKYWSTRGVKKIEPELALGSTSENNDFLLKLMIDGRVLQAHVIDVDNHGYKNTIKKFLVKPV